MDAQLYNLFLDKLKNLDLQGAEIPVDNDSYVYANGFIDYLSKGEKNYYSLSTPSSDDVKRVLSSGDEVRWRQVDIELAARYHAARSSRIQKADNRFAIVGKKNGRRAVDSNSIDALSLLFLDYGEMQNDEQLKETLRDIVLQYAVLELENAWNKELSPQNVGEFVIPSKLIGPQNKPSPSEQELSLRIKGTTLKPLGNSHTIKKVREAVGKLIAGEKASSGDLPMVSTLDSKTDPSPIKPEDKLMQILYPLYFSGIRIDGNQVKWRWHLRKSYDAFPRKSLIPRGIEGKNRWKTAGKLLAKFVFPHKLSKELRSKRMQGIQDVFATLADQLAIEEFWDLLITLNNYYARSRNTWIANQRAKTANEKDYLFFLTQDTGNSPQSRRGENAETLITAYDELIDEYLAPLFTSVLYCVTYGSDGLGSLRLNKKAVCETKYKSIEDSPGSSLLPENPESPQKKRYGLLVVQYDIEERRMPNGKIDTTISRQRYDEIRPLSEKSALLVGRAPEAADPDIFLPDAMKSAYEDGKSGEKNDEVKRISSKAAIVSRYALKFSQSNERVRIFVANKNGASWTTPFGESHTLDAGEMKPLELNQSILIELEDGVMVTNDGTTITAIPVLSFTLVELVSSPEDSAASNTNNVSDKIKKKRSDQNIHVPGDPDCLNKTMFDEILGRLGKKADHHRDTQKTEVTLDYLERLCAVTEKKFSVERETEKRYLKNQETETEESDKKKDGERFCRRSFLFHRNRAVWIISLEKAIRFCEDLDVEEAETIKNRFDLLKEELVAFGDGRS